MNQTKYPRDLSKIITSRIMQRTRIKPSLEFLEDRLTPAVIGYYDMTLGQGDISQEAAIIASGNTPVQLLGVTAGDLTGIDVLDVQNEDNGGYGAAYLASLSEIQNAVSAGMVLVIHDRFVDDAESILPNGAGFNIIRDFAEGSDINVLDNTTLVTNGPGGIVDDTTLDGGNYSSHGYADAATLPANSKLILSQTDPSHIVTFGYGFGGGTVIYSSIPLDYYLFSGANNFSDIYAPNVLAWAVTNPCGQQLPPVAVADFYTTNEDTTLNVNAANGVLRNDSGTNGFPLSAVLVSDVSHGTLTFRADGSFTYVPNPNANDVTNSGPDTFTYLANDTLFDSNIVTVTINVNPVNDAPVANPDGYPNTVYIVKPGKTLSIPARGVLLNDTDIDNNPATLTATKVSSTFRGDVTLASNGAITYTAYSNSTGIDSFDYVANDGQANSQPATVTFRVNSQPVSNNDLAKTIVGTSVNGNVLTNDTDFDKDTMKATLISTTPNGSLTLNANGTFTYQPNAGFFGTDTFTYRADDPLYNAANPDQVGNVATVSIRVDRLPVATPDLFNVKKNTVLEIFSPGVLVNDTDADKAQYGDILQAELVTGTTHGTLTFDVNGYVKYVPNANYTGPDSFTYRVTDGLFFGNTTTVAINVQQTPTANVDSYLTFSPQLDVSASAGVLSNDTSTNGNPLTARILSGPVNGALTFNSNGSFTYVASNGFTGVDQFTYIANDGVFDSGPATVTLMVFKMNEPPVANNDEYSTPANTQLNLVAPGVLVNDTDPNGDALTATLVTGPTKGTLLLHADGSMTYTPQAGFNGIDTFTYQTSDSQSLSNIATVKITVGTPPVQPPSPNRRIVMGQETGGFLKVLVGETGQTLFTIQPYTGYTGGIRVATGDVNGDGTPDIITAPGSQTGTGAGLKVRVFNGVNGNPLPGTLGTGMVPFGTNYRGGIYVAAGDVNGDGFADIILGAQATPASGLPWVRTFSGKSGTVFTNWFGGINPYTGTGFAGVRVAAGDVNGDGRADIITSPGGGMPQVKVYNPAATTVTKGLLSSFNANSTAVAGGVFISAGDLDGDGKAEIVASFATGTANNLTGQVRIFNGTTGVQTKSLTITGLSAAPRVAVGDIDGDGDLDLVVSITKAGQQSRAAVYDLLTLAELTGYENKFPYGGGYTGGLFTAALPKPAVTVG